MVTDVSNGNMLCARRNDWFDGYVDAVEFFFGSLRISMLKSARQPKCSVFARRTRRYCKVTMLAISMDCVRRLLFLGKDLR